MLIILREYSLKRLFSIALQNNTHGGRIVKRSQKQNGTPMLKINNNSINETDCDNYRPKQEYTHFQELIDNLPYALMAVIGIAIQLLGFGASMWGWAAGGFYLIYSVVGAAWIIIFVCPFCQYYNTRACPCGYGKIAAKFRPKSSEDRFAEKFKKHIPVIVPLWIIPVVSGAMFLIRDFNRSMLFLVTAFIINSFIVLPLLSREYGCAHCPQKDDCPWMRQKQNAK